MFLISSDTSNYLFFLAAALCSIYSCSCSLLLMGPLIVQFFLTLSCIIVIGVNLSQFICIGQFFAGSFQVLRHMKTLLVLSLEFLFFGKEGLNLWAGAAWPPPHAAGPALPPHAAAARLHPREGSLAASHRPPAW